MNYLRWAFVAAAVFTLSACGMMRLSDNLPKGITENNDTELVKEALPSYLVTVDGLIANWPEKTSWLTTGASLNSAYGSLFVEDEERQQKLTAKALDYAQRGACSHKKQFCDFDKMSVPKIEERLAKAKKKDVDVIYTLGTTWATYIQTHSDDHNALADLARVQTLLETSAELDETYDYGQANLYLAVLDSILPAALGGQPERAKDYYKKAITLSDGKNLYAKVLYAEHYARMAFDQELHDGLLEEVLEADPRAPELTLQNTFAQEEAERLLAESDDYF